MEEKEVASIKPNLKKVFAYNLLKVLFGVIVVIGSLIYINHFVSLKVFAAAFKVLGVTVDATKLLPKLVIGVSAVAALLLLLSYFSLGKIRYVFYYDKLAIYQNFMVVQVSEKIIPYSNITKVGVEKGGIINQLMNSARVVIELSGMKENKVKLEFIDYAQDKVADMQKLIEQSNAARVTQVGDEMKFQGIIRY